MVLTSLETGWLAGKTLNAQKYLNFEKGQFTAYI